MNDILKKIILNENIENIIEIVINNIYENGPINRSDLEIFSFKKFFHPDIFEQQSDDQTPARLYPDLQVPSTYASQC